jgi:hypothetical protein
MQATDPTFLLSADWIAHFWRVYRKPDFIRRRGPLFCLPGIIPEIEKEQKKTDFTISKDKAILLSPMCFLQFIHNSTDNDSKNMLKYIVKKRMDVIGEIDVNLDGKPIKDKLVRQASDLFSLDYVFTAASDGYWLLLQPGELDKGMHHIDTYGTCSSGVTKVPLHFKVTIK